MVGLWEKQMNGRHKVKLIVASWEKKRDAMGKGTQSASTGNAISSPKGGYTNLSRYFKTMQV